MEGYCCRRCNIERIYRRFDWYPDTCIGHRCHFRAKSLSLGTEQQGNALRPLALFAELSDVDGLCIRHERNQSIALRTEYFETSRPVINHSIWDVKTCAYRRSHGLAIEWITAPRAQQYARCAERSGVPENSSYVVRVTDPLDHNQRTTGLHLFDQYPGLERCRALRERQVAEVKIVAADVFEEC